MKVTLTESGGFANIQRRCTVDTVDLPSDVGTRLESIIRQGGLFALHPGPGAARDARHFVIEVDCGGQRRSASFDETSAPPDARPVIEMLRPYCRIVPAQTKR